MKDLVNTSFDQLNFLVMLRINTDLDTSAGPVCLHMMFLNVRQRCHTRWIEIACLLKCCRNEDSNKLLHHNIRSPHHSENMPIQIYRRCHLQKLKQISDKNSDIFRISAQNIDCEYSLETPRRGGSNDYPQSMLFSKIRKIMYNPVNLAIKNAASQYSNSNEQMHMSEGTFFDNVLIYQRVWIVCFKCF